jgi:hypothetical protein
MLCGTLIPQPLLPQEKGSKIHIIFCFPSPAGEGLGVRATAIFICPQIILTIISYTRSNLIVMKIHSASKNQKNNEKYI